MKTNFIALAGLCLGLGLCAGAPTQAQITTAMNDHGKIVFVNAEPAMARNGSARHKTNGGSGDFSGSAKKVALPKHLEHLVSQAAERHRLDPALIKAVIGVESGGNPGAISRKGAQGLMQLVPSTAQRFGVGDALDPAQNVEGGVRYLRTLLDRYNGDLERTLAAYNAGENAVDRSGGVPNYAETRAYVRKVTDSYFQPGSGHQIERPAPPVRRTTDEQGRVVFTNE